MCVSGFRLKKLGMVGQNNILFCQNILFSKSLVMSELGSSEKNNMKYCLYDKYYKTTDRYEMHINKTLGVRTCLYLFSRKEEMNLDKVQF